MQRDEAQQPLPEDDSPESARRRTFLGTAIAGAAGIGISSALVACGKPATQGAAPAATASAGAAPEGGKLRYDVPPGQLDDYYMMSSGGHSGEMRIYGVPSGRTLKRIPVFNIDPMAGWGITNESKKILGTKPDGTPIRMKAQIIYDF